MPRGRRPRWRDIPAFLVPKSKSFKRVLTNTRSLSRPKPSSLLRLRIMATEDPVRELGIGGLKRHIFLCRGPDCCALEKGQEVWEYLKKRLKELGLSDADGGVYRSRVDCLRICK